MLSSDTALLPSPLSKLGVFEYDLAELTRLEPRVGLRWLLSREDERRAPEDSRCEGVMSIGDAVAEAGLEFWLLIFGVGRPLGG